MTKEMEFMSKLEMQKEIDKLKAELKERQEAFDRASCCVVEERLVNERLEEKLKIARDALAFYANPKKHRLAGEWSDGYPGGIVYDVGSVCMLDTGQIAEKALTTIDNNNCACGGYMEVIYGGKGRRCNKCGKESK